MKKLTKDLPAIDGEQNNEEDHKITITNSGDSKKQEQKKGFIESKSAADAHPTNQIHHIILDCSGWGYVDATGAKLLIDV